MQPVAEFFKEENDFLYCRGFGKGFRKGFESTEYGSWMVGVIKNIIAQTDVSDEKIAIIADVPLSLVENIRNELKKC